MANEFQYTGESGLDLYVVLRGLDPGDAWHVEDAEFVEFDIEDREAFKIDFFEIDGDGGYAGDMPTGIPRGAYNYVVYAVSDNSKVARGVVNWDGTIEITKTELDREIDAIEPCAASGDGAVEVNHDYGGADALAYKTSGGTGIDNAVIRAYLASNYNAGERGTSFVLATVVTDVNGRWSRSMMLDPGDYVLFCYKQGAYGPNSHNLTVTD